MTDSCPLLREPRGTSWENFLSNGVPFTSDYFTIKLDGAGGAVLPPVPNSYAPMS